MKRATTTVWTLTEDIPEEGARHVSVHGLLTDAIKLIPSGHRGWQGPLPDGSYQWDHLDAIWSATPTTLEVTIRD